MISGFHLPVGRYQSVDIDAVNLVLDMNRFPLCFLLTLRSHRSGFPPPTAKDSVIFELSSASLTNKRQENMRTALIA